MEQFSMGAATDICSGGCAWSEGTGSWRSLIVWKGWRIASVARREWLGMAVLRCAKSYGLFLAHAAQNRVSCARCGGVVACACAKCRCLLGAESNENDFACTSDRGIARISIMWTAAVWRASALTDLLVCDLISRACLSVAVFANDLEPIAPDVL